MARPVEPVEGVVAGQQDAIDSSREVQRVPEQTRGQHAAAGDVDVGGEVFGHPSVEMGRDAGEAVDPIEREQEHLAPVPEDDLQAGMAVEGAAQDETQGRQPRLDVPPHPKVARASSVVGSKPAVGRVPDRVRGDLGVDEHRPPQSGGSGEQFVVGGVVQRAVAAAAVRHDPDVTGRVRCPLKFGDGQRRGLTSAASS